MTEHKTIVTLLAAATLMLAAVSPASGDYLHNLYYKGTTGLGESVKLHAPGTLADGDTVYAGQMKYEYRGENFVSYCVDIDHWAGSSKVDELDISSLNRGNEIAYLFLSEADNVMDELGGAAMQVALWELLYETDGHALNVIPELDDGFSIRLRRHNSSDVAVADAANALLATLGDMPAGWDAGTSVTLLHTESHQDTILPTGDDPTTVPEPCTAAVLGLGGVCVMLRRRRITA